MKIIAVDDERLQLETLVEYVSDIYPSAHITGFDKVSDVIEYSKNETIDVAILDISMPGNINGINLGELLRQNNNRVKILYCTGYSDYAIDAFKMHANGYLQKPIRKEDLKRELAYILQMPVFDNTDKPYAHTFGNFDIFVNGRPVLFKRNRAKEILAYLIDRKGTWVTNRELAAILWEETDDDAALIKYITTLTKAMIVGLEQVGSGHIVERQRGKVRLLVSEINCDYYDYLSGDKNVHFNGEYMNQYSWAENTLASITNI